MGLRDEGTASDSLHLDTALVGASVAYRPTALAPLSWHAGIGALVGSVLDDRDGVFTSEPHGQQATRTEYGVSPAQRRVASYLYMSLGVTAGFHPAPRWWLGLEVEAMPLVALHQPTWDSNRTFQRSLRTQLVFQRFAHRKSPYSLHSGYRLEVRTLSKATSRLHAAARMALGALLATIASVNMFACDGDRDAHVVYLDSSIVDDGRAPLPDVSSADGDEATPVLTDAVAEADAAQRDTQGDEQADAPAEALVDAVTEAREDEDERDGGPAEGSPTDADSEGDLADGASDGDDESHRALPDAFSDGAMLPLSQWQLGTFPVCVADQGTACSREQVGFTVHAQSSCTAQSEARLWFPAGPLSSEDYEVLPVNKSPTPTMSPRVA